MKNNGLTDNYFQHMTKASFEKSQNNTGSTERVMAQTPTVELDLRRKKLKG